MKKQTQCTNDSIPRPGLHRELASTLGKYQNDELLGKGWGGCEKGGIRLRKLFTKMVIWKLSLESQVGFVLGAVAKAGTTTVEDSCIFRDFPLYRSAITAHRGLGKDTRNVSLWKWRALRTVIQA